MRNAEWTRHFPFTDGAVIKNSVSCFGNGVRTRTRGPGEALCMPELRDSPGVDDEEEDDECGMSEDYSSIEEYTETDEVSEDCSEGDEEI